MKTRPAIAVTSIKRLSRWEELGAAVRVLAIHINKLYLATAANGWTKAHFYTELDAHIQRLNELLTAATTDGIIESWFQNSFDHVTNSISGHIMRKGTKYLYYADVQGQSIFCSEDALA